MQAKLKKIQYNKPLTINYRLSAIRYTLLAICLILSFTSLATNVVGQSVDFNEDFNIDDNIGLEQIKVPFFPQLALDTKYSTTMSYVSFGFNIILLGIVAFWIIKIVMTGIKAMKNATNQEGLQEAAKKVRAVLEGAALTFLFPIILIVVGAFFGLGAVWNWPLAFRECNTTINGKEVQYYYQAIGLLESKEEADSMCFIQ